MAQLPLGYGPHPSLQPPAGAHLGELWQEGAAEGLRYMTHSERSSLGQAWLWKPQQQQQRAGAVAAQSQQHPPPSLCLEKSLIPNPNMSIMSSASLSCLELNLAIRSCLPDLLSGADYRAWDGRECSPRVDLVPCRGQRGSCVQGRPGHPWSLEGSWLDPSQGDGFGWEICLHCGQKFCEPLHLLTRVSLCFCRFLPLLLRWKSATEPSPPGPRQSIWVIPSRCPAQAPPCRKAMSVLHP